MIFCKNQYPPRIKSEGRLFAIMLYITGSTARDR
jgi:hypothetical protein